MAFTFSGLHNNPSGLSPEPYDYRYRPTASPGLFLYPDYTTQEEEQLQLLDMLDDPLAVLPRWKASRFNGQANGKHWGVYCHLRDRRVDSPEYALPSVLMDTIVHHHRWDHLSCGPIPTTNPSSSPSLTILRPNEAPNAIDYRKSRGDWLQAHVDDQKLSKEPMPIRVWQATAS